MVIMMTSWLWELWMWSRRNWQIIHFLSLSLFTWFNPWHRLAAFTHCESCGNPLRGEASHLGLSEVRVILRNLTECLKVFTSSRKRLKLWKIPLRYLITIYYPITSPSPVKFDEGSEEKKDTPLLGRESKRLNIIILEIASL